MNPLQQQQAVFKIGVVAETDPATHSARVRFDDLDGLETMRLPVGVHKSLKDKSYWMPDVGEHVSCLLDLNAETGVILCAIYSEADVPPVNSQDKRHVTFSDGTWVEYDRAEHRLEVHCVGDIGIFAGGHLALESKGRMSFKSGEDIQAQAERDVKIHANEKMELLARTRLLLRSVADHVVKKCKCGVRVW